jgi:hypothetical protein
MANNYIPQKLADMVVWALNFASQCSGTGASHGLSAGQVTAVNTAVDNFNVAYLVSSVPASRTPVAVADTEAMKQAMLAVVQPAAMILQSNASFTDALRATYGLTIPKTTRTPVPVPTAIPDLSINSISSGHITLRAKTLGAVGNAKPVGSIACRVYRSSGASAPTSLDGMTYLGDMTNRFFDDALSGIAPGAQVWYAAVFATRTNKVGPMSSVITANVSA